MGITCLTMVRKFFAPMARCAMMYSFSLTLMVVAHIRRVYPGMVAIPRAMMTFWMPAPSTATSSKASYTTAKTKIGAILDDPTLRTIVDKHVPGLSGRAQIGLARSMTLKQLQNYSEEFSDPVLAKIDAEFAELPPPAKKP